jgi:hypothetical protein
LNDLDFDFAIAISTVAVLDDVVDDLANCQLDQYDLGFRNVKVL